MLRVDSARSVHDPPSSLPELVGRWYGKIASTGILRVELTAWTRSELMRPCFAMLVMSSVLLEPVHLHAILVCYLSWSKWAACCWCFGLQQRNESNDQGRSIYVINAEFANRGRELWLIVGLTTVRLTSYTSDHVVCINGRSSSYNGATYESDMRTCIR